MNKHEILRSGKGRKTGI